MTTSPRVTLSRRRFLSLTGALAVGGLALGATGLWPRWAQAEPALARRLLRLGRDIYPHESIEDRYYLAPLTPLLEARRDEIAAGLDDLDRRARAAHGRDYGEIEGAAEREALLREIQSSDFFQAVRGALVVGLYDTPELWEPHFGYQGSSWEQGGYLNRGYNDLVIDWL